MKLPILVVVALCSLTTLCSGVTRDTLAHFDPASISAFYRDPGIRAQAARFDLAAPARLRSVTFWLAGSGTGSVQFRIYGNEGAFSAPLLNQPLSSTVTVTKDAPGVQRITVPLDDDLLIDRPQFFVVVDHLDPGIRLLSDRTEKHPACQTAHEQWTYQALLGANNRWQSGKYGFAIEVVVEYPEETPPGFLADVTAEAELLPDPVGNRSIAWGDIDGSGRVDLLVSGKLYLNAGDDRFEDVTDRIASGTQGPTDEKTTYQAHIFIDIDNDRDLDILFLGGPDGRAALELNDGKGFFRSQECPLPPTIHPTTVAVADVDSDGDLDLFVGQGLDSLGGERASLLLVNTGAGTFQVRSDWGSPDRPLPGGVIGAQWIDKENDGDPDLYLTTYHAEANELYLNDGTGMFRPSTLRGKESHGPSGSASTAMASRPGSAASGISGTSDWIDRDGDGVADLLQPVSLPLSALPPPTLAGSPDDVLPPYEGWAGGGTWTDVNNDGRIDLLITSSCDCRYAALYTGETTGEMTERSYEYGLFRLPAGSDAVWVDYDNDGKLDLATFVGDRFHLLKNTGHYQGNYVAVDLSGSPDPGSTINGRLMIYADNQVRTTQLSYGRGALMQGPLRIHVGLDQVEQIDSIILLYDGDQRRSLMAPAVNRLHPLFGEGERNGQTTARASVAVAPNPFRHTLRFTVTLPERQHVQIALYTIDGTPVGLPMDEEQEAGTVEIQWQPEDRYGAPLPPGTYIWRATLGGEIVTGRSVLIR